MAILQAIVCDEPGCERYKIAPSRSAVRSAARTAGWAEREGDFCPDHYPLRPCGFCGKPMRPWSRRSRDPGMAGTVPVGSGGRCQTCVKGHLERMLDRAIDSYYARRPNVVGSITTNWREAS